MTRDEFLTAILKRHPGLSYQPDYPPKQYISICLCNPHGIAGWMKIKGTVKDWPVPEDYQSKNRDYSEWAKVFGIETEEAK